MKLLHPVNLHDYQKRAINHQCSHPDSMMWVSMGLGKTVITLSSIAHLIDTGFLNGVIIVAPIRVVRLVWRQEAVKWEHTKHLTFSVVAGTKDQRTRAILRKADVYLINYENLGWLASVLEQYFVKKNKPLPFNGLVWDEISKMKNSNTHRVKAFMKIKQHFVWSTGLTGTPASNGYKDLHGQYLVVDGGVRLGTSKTAFRQRFYFKNGPYKEIPYPDTEETIKALIGDITLEMSAEDYNPLPDLMVNDIELEMPEGLRAKYDQMERDLFLRLDSGQEKEMFNQAALTNACLQFSNGAMYPIAGMPLWEPIHSMKLEALEDIVEEANGEPILCAYAYRSDAQRIMEHFKGLAPINLTECKSESALKNAMARWKAGDCPLMIGHPACLGEDTLVLTERNGWVRIVEVDHTDRVFDGVEFVEHRGCQYSGIKSVIDVFGITMTPDHKLLIDGDWVEARDVKTDQRTRRKALYQYQGDDESLSEMYSLRNNLGVRETEFHQAQQAEEKTLQSLYSRHFSQDDEHQNLSHLVRNEKPNIETGYRVQYSKLWGSWNICLRKVVKIRVFLRRYGTELSRWLNSRTHRCQWSLLQGKLLLGYQYDATSEQTQQSGGCISGRDDPSGRTRAPERSEQNEALYEVEQGYEWGRSCNGRRDIRIWQKPKSSEHQTSATPVYDLVNCGPRHRFLIKNNKGEMFISHNSMGHGVDGLQDRGHILAWFGLNWSLDLYEQFNARLRRQGQGVPVICHRIMVQNTLDQAQALALDEKASTQTALRAAVKEYRKQRGI